LAAEEKFLDTVLTFEITSSDDLNTWKSKANLLDSAVNELPPNVHLLTLEQWKDGKKLVRLEHQVEKLFFNEIKVFSNMNCFFLV